MSTDFTSASDLIVAWAMPVNLAQLGARLAAYAETKATITTFRLVARYTTESACYNMPEEILSIIASEVRDTVFKRNINLWVKRSQCLANKCTTMSHVPKAELSSLAGVVISNKFEYEEWLAEEFAEEVDEEHQKKVRQYCNALTNPESTSRITKSIKIFTKDFGIHPYFVIHKFYEDCDYDYEDGYHIDHVKTKAFLTLPLQHVPITSGPGLRVGLFSINSILNPSALTGLTECQRRQFMIAVNTLGLRLYNANKDATMFDRKSKMRDASSVQEGTDSENSKNCDEDKNSAESDAAISGCEKNPRMDAKSENAESEYAESEEAESEQVESEEAESEDGDSEEEEGTWPRLMILGRGKLEVIHYY